MQEKPQLNLTDEDGNAFVIITRARRQAINAGWDDARIKAMCDDAMSGDYDHVLQTMSRYFDVT